MEEKELFAQYRRTGDLALRNQIVEQYLFVAKMIAKKFVGRGVEYDDLLQVASLALLKGVDRFDENVGVKFSTFITPTITGEIKNYFRDKSRLIHLPRRVAELRAQIKRTSEEFLSQEGKSPTARELATLLNATEEEIVSAMEAGSVVSLDKTVEGEEDSHSSFYDFIAAENPEIEQIEQKDCIRSALKHLNEQEKTLVNYRFGQGLSQTETAKRMDVSQMYISRLERKVIDKLRENFKKSMAD